MQKQTCIIDLSGTEIRAGMLADGQFQTIDLNLPWDIGFRQEDDTLVACFGEELKGIDANRPNEVNFTTLDVKLKDISDPKTLNCLFGAFIEEIIHQRLREHPAKLEARRQPEGMGAVRRCRHDDHSRVGSEQRTLQSVRFPQGVGQPRRDPQRRERWGSDLQRTNAGRAHRGSARVRDSRLHGAGRLRQEARRWPVGSILEKGRGADRRPLLCGLGRGRPRECRQRDRPAVCRANRRPPLFVRAAALLGLRAGRRRSVACCSGVEAGIPIVSDVSLRRVRN